MLKNEHLVRMGEVRDEWCVSIYMPIAQADAPENRARLKNLLADAARKLLSLEMIPIKVARLLAPIEMILDHSGFWKDRKEGFVAFFTQDSFVWYSMQYQVDELVVVTDRFHLKPLLRNAAENRRFHLLALGENQIKFFEASELGINEIYLKGIPHNPAHFWNSETKENQAGEDDRTSRLSELFRKVDKAVTGYLKNDEAPLVLAGAEYLHPIYHEANTYPHILKERISGEMDKLAPQQLLKKALPIIKPVFRRKRENAMEIYQEKLGKGLASNNFEKIFKAAKDGKIEMLFVPVGKQKWGKFDPQTDELRIHQQARPGDKDLLCVTSTRTLRKGGEVFVVLPEQMPENSSIAAVLRQ
jgi:hypothetical protein